MKTHHNSLVIIILLAVLSLAGCTATGHRFDPSQASQIRKGVTTRTELVAMFGQPTGQQTNSESVCTLFWTYGQSNTNPMSFVPVVGMVCRGSNYQGKTLRVTLNPNGTVRSYTVSEHTSNQSTMGY